MLTSEGGQDSNLLHIPCRFPSLWKKALFTMDVLFCHLPGGNECGKTASLALPLLAFIKESKNCYWLFVKPHFQNTILVYSHEIYQRKLNLGIHVGLKSHPAHEFCMGGHYAVMRIVVLHLRLHAPSVRIRDKIRGGKPFLCPKVAGWCVSWFKK